MIETTTVLPPLAFKIPAGLHDVRSQGSSAAGFSAISNYLTCPEASRLRASGIRPKPRGYTSEMDALTFGSVAHAFCAIRVVYGETAAHDWLRKLYEQGDVLIVDYEKLRFMFKVYDQLWPLANDPFQYLGVEVEVKTNIKDRAGGDLVRTVRYDAVIKYPNGDVYTFERKTGARSGASALEPYWPQAMVQTMLWNENEALVAQHGRMKGVLFDHMIKTQTPKVERQGPIHFSKLQNKLALDYMRLPETTGFVRNEDGSYPKFIHSCFGRFRACEYFGLCHEDAQGDYQIGDGYSSDEEVV